MQGKYPPKKEKPERTCMQNIRGSEPPEALAPYLRWLKKVMTNMGFIYVFIYCHHLLLSQKPSSHAWTPLPS